MAPSHCAGLLGTGARSAADEEYRFEASEFEKKPYEFGGYLEAKPQYFWLNPGSAGYNLTYPGGSPGNAVYGATGTLELVGKYTAGIATARFRTHSDIQRYNTVNQESNKFYEAVLSIRPDPGFTADLGKVALQWGKGYAQTFVGFVQRPKDPDDPELARQGYTIADADLIRNFDGPLQTVALTPVILPVSSRVNDDYGVLGHVNYAAKLYLLLHDTDIDFMYLAKGSRPARFGTDFSRNLATNFEIHGELAYIWNASKPVVNSTGQVTIQQGNAMNYMVGMRYLTEQDTTFIVEYYHNGLGYSEGQMGDFYGFVDQDLWVATCRGQRDSERDQPVPRRLRATQRDAELSLRAGDPEGTVRLSVFFASNHDHGQSGRSQFPGHSGAALYRSEGPGTPLAALRARWRCGHGIRGEGEFTPPGASRALLLLA